MTTKNNLLDDNIMINDEIVNYFKRNRLTVNELEYVKVLSSTFYDNIRDILPEVLPESMSIEGIIKDAIIHVINNKTKEECLKDLIFCNNTIYHELLTALKSEYQTYNFTTIIKYTQAYFVQFNALIRMFEYKIRKY